MGETVEDAFAHVVNRLHGIENALERLGAVPFQGAVLPNIVADLRHVTKDGAIFYFMTDAKKRQVLVLSVFFSGQDHGHHILKRIPDF